MHIGFYGKIRREDGTRGRIMLRWVLEKYSGVVWTGFILPKIGINGGVFWIR
jgi:hypothetical protein